MWTAGDDLEEPSEKGADQVGCERIDHRLTATSDHVGQERQSQRVTVAELDQLIVTCPVDATGGQVLTTVAWAQVAKRHDSQQIAPMRGRRAGPNPVAPARRRP